MATWSRRTRVTTHIEWLVPFGYVGDLDKAEWAAWVEYCRIRGWDATDTTTRSDDWATFSADDEHVIIRIEASKVRDE